MSFALFPPSPETLKSEARVLREDCAARGEVLSHSEALERVAKSHGYRDWNTAVASLKPRTGCPLAIGDRVEGLYLKQPFVGTVIGLAARGAAQLFAVTIHFDQPVDVVTFDSFSAFRSRVSSTIDPYGVSPARTSDGEPHMRVARLRK